MLGALQNIHLNSSVNLDNFMKLTHILSKFFLTHILSNGDKTNVKSHNESFSVPHHLRFSSFTKLLYSQPTTSHTIDE
jgi:hypothetical protein